MLLVSIGIIYFSYNYRIKLKTQPVSVPYAVKEIGPRTRITNDMVSIKKVPGGVVTDDVILSTNSIVDRYVTNTAVVPEGSMFYNSVVVNWDQFSDFYSDIPNDYTVYELSVDSDSTFGNSIFPGNYIDIYFKTTKNENGNRIWIGKFIENAKVLAVHDSQDNSVFETNGNPRKPAKLAFAVPTDLYVFFNKITGIGQSITLFPVQRNSSYSNSKEEKKMNVVNSEFVDYVNSFAVDDSILKGGN